MVPYQCLLGQTTSTVDTFPSPAKILPSTLEHLKVHYPQIYVYDGLFRLCKVPNRLPLLSEAELYCLRRYGDNYDVFAFVHREHYVFFCGQGWDRNGHRVLIVILEEGME